VHPNCIAQGRKGISVLLEPIPGEKKGGESLRYTKVYDKIRESRREDNDALPQGVWKAELKKADWDQVAYLCQDALRHNSKDLQIAVWLVEARLHLEGIEGLAKGLQFVLQLTHTFWDVLYPQMEGGGELRLRLYEWLNMRLSEKIQFIPVSHPSDNTFPSYRLLDFNEASRLDVTSENNHPPGEREGRGEPAPSLNKISLSINKTSRAYYLSMDKNCALALKTLTQLEEELRSHFGKETPSFYRLRDKIDALHRFARQVLEARGEIKETKKMTSKPTPATNSSPKPFKGPIETREQAYLILGEVARYLERIEPHSPTPYLIHRAISWGDMNLSQVVSNVLTEEGGLALLLDLLNVKKEPESQQ
jgi:type VI secretion system protein ImpA